MHIYRCVFILTRTDINGRRVTRLLKATSLLCLLEESDELLHSPELVGSRGSRSSGLDSLLRDDRSGGRGNSSGLGSSGLSSVAVAVAVALTLDALRVVSVLGLAGPAGHAGGAASVALATALTVGLNSGARARVGAGRLGLGDSGKSSRGSSGAGGLGSSRRRLSDGGLSGDLGSRGSSRAVLELLQPGDELSHGELGVASGLGLKVLGEGVDVVFLVASLRSSGGGRSSSGSSDRGRGSGSGNLGGGRLSNSRGHSSGCGRGSRGGSSRGGNGSAGGRGRGTAGGSGDTLDLTEGQELGVNLGSALVEGRSRHGVRVKRSVDRETKARTSLRVCLRELDTLRGGGTVTSDLELVAGDIVLSTTGGRGSVESDGLSAEEVVTRSDIIRDGEVKLSAVVVQVLGAPEIGVTLGRARGLLPAVLVDLEELGRAISSGSILDLGEIGHDGTPVSTANTLLLAVTAARLLVHLNCDCVTSCEAALAGSSSRVNIALQSSG
ncbi:hypothetical protein B5807_01189 [Epicoccum nigrum]|uniref:Uncharacterized protein n=1 Tax=Epicoccum nigrum TaxID=105696 RepID=A0A1Y2MHT9_EPING|nr:hypothetical protein B5807_01189 [Epicoccum nigrum]